MARIIFDIPDLHKNEEFARLYEKPCELYFEYSPRFQPWERYCDKILCSYYCVPKISTLGKRIVINPVARQLLRFKGFNLGTQKISSLSPRLKPWAMFLRACVNLCFANFAVKIKTTNSQSEFGFYL